MEGNNTAVIPSIYGKLIDMDLNGERMAHVFHVDDFVCVSKDVRSILVEEQGFISEFIYDFYNDMLNGCNGSSNNDTRGLYIDDTLYLVRPDVVNAFDMKNSYQKVGQYSIS